MLCLAVSLDVVQMQGNHQILQYYILSDLLGTQVDAFCHAAKTKSYTHEALTLFIQK